MSQSLTPGLIADRAVRIDATSEHTLSYNDPLQARIRRSFTHSDVSAVVEGPRSLFNSAPWISVIQDTYGFKLQASTIESSGRVQAAILFVEVDDLRGRRVLSLPFSDYCDPFVDSFETWQALVAPILELGAPVRFRSLYSALPTSDPRFNLTGGSLWHCADLTRPEDQIWADMRDNARQNIRRAERGGIIVREGRRLEDVYAFYRMHSNLRKTKYRMFAQPISFFEHIHSAFANDGRLIVLLAEHEGTPIAGILFLIHDNTLYYKFNASTETALRPNDLLVWTGMKIARRAGLSRLDFGVSDIDQPGLIRFKRKFATEERPVAYTSWFPSGYKNAHGDEAGRLLGELTRILTSPDVDSSLTRSVGDVVYRYFC